MIDKGDEQPRFCEAPPAPQFIAFMQQGEEVGRLWLEDPLRFEGRAEESASVFFSHVIAGNDRVHILAKKLLEAVKCPDGNCDGEGTCCAEKPGYDGEPDIDVWECEWCARRNQLIGVSR